MPIPSFLPSPPAVLVMKQKERKGTTTVCPNCAASSPSRWMRCHQASNFDLYPLSVFTFLMVNGLTSKLILLVFLRIFGSSAKQSMRSCQALKVAARMFCSGSLKARSTTVIMALMVAVLVCKCRPISLTSTCQRSSTATSRSSSSSSMALKAGMSSFAMKSRVSSERSSLGGPSS